MRLPRAVIAALTPVIAWSLAACDPLNTGFEEVESAQMYEASEPTAPPEDLDRLTVMTWNIKFGGGRLDFFYDCHGERVIMGRDEVFTHLEGLAEKINQVDPDVLILQEVDVDSKRTANIDQVEWLLENTDLNYGAYASQWRSRYIPKHGLGKVDSGNAILTRWPLEDAERIALPLIDAQDPITRYFYLKRNILRARLEVPDREPLWVFNTHTVAFATDDTRARQIALIEEELSRLDEAGETFVLGADLNTLPPHSERRKDFPDTACDDENPADDYTDEVGLLDRMYERFEPAISLERYREDNEPYFTHSTSADYFWTRKLDYLFTNGSFVDGSGLVHQDESSGGMETMPLSDHAPVVAEFEWVDR